MVSINIIKRRGGSRIFIGGGGGDAKDYVRERTLRARNAKSLSTGVGPLEGPAWNWKLYRLFMLSRAT